MAGGIGRAGSASAPTTSPRQRRASQPTAAGLMGLRLNQLAAALVIPARAYSAPGSHNPWPLLVGAHTVGPISIGDSERRDVRVPRSHMDGTACQMRHRCRLRTRSEKGE
jgi:hypothetical protein